jgi:hypothetical protein
VNEAAAEKQTPLVAVAVRDHADRFQPKLGAPLEPLKDTRAAETQHEHYAYGSAPTVGKAEGVASLFALGMGAPIVTEDDDKERMLLTSLARSSFAETAPALLATRVGGPMLEAVESAEQALVDMDVLRSERVTGLLERTDVEPILAEHGLLELVHEHLPDTKLVNYRALLTELRRGQLRRTNDGSLARTSTEHVRPCGHGTVRTDLAKKTLKSVMEFRNLGDEGSVATVISPSHATRRGLDDDALTSGRDKAFIQKLFTNAGITNIPFEAVWRGAVAADGRASIQAFQQALEAAST